MSHILLVDDDEPFRKMIRINLMKMGHVVSEARNGKEALASYAAAPPDLVLTDLIMPDKEGLETIEALRRNNPGVKIVAMSGGGRASATDYLRIAKVMGASHVLAKPFSMAELTFALDALLGKAPGAA